MKLAWPIPYEEFVRRNNIPLPGWDAVPGGDWRKNARPVSTQSALDFMDDSDALPHSFELVQDKERERQLACIQALFSDADGVSSYREDAIDELLNTEDGEEGDEEDAE